MKPGDIIMIFGNPVTLEHPIGQARLIKKISTTEQTPELEQWTVEYLCSPEHFYTALIRNSNAKRP
jgi:hypothetical protein